MASHMFRNSIVFKHGGAKKKMHRQIQQDWSLCESLSNSTEDQGDCRNMGCRNFRMEKKYVRQPKP